MLGEEEEFRVKVTGEEGGSGVTLYPLPPYRYPKKRIDEHPPHCIVTQFFFGMAHHHRQSSAGLAEELDFFFNFFRKTFA